MASAPFVWLSFHIRLVDRSSGDEGQVVLPGQCTPGDLESAAIPSEVKACAARVGEGGDETPQGLKSSLSHLKVEQSGESVSVSVTETLHDSTADRLSS